MESIEASLSAEECARKACQKSRRKRCFDHRKAELLALRHDNSSIERQPRENKISEKGERFWPFLESREVFMKILDPDSVKLYFFLLNIEIS